MLFRRSWIARAHLKIHGKMRGIGRVLPVLKSPNKVKLMKVALYVGFAICILCRYVNI